MPSINPRFSAIPILATIALLIALGVAVNHWLIRQDASPLPPASAVTANGPWGKLERVRITIARPTALISTAQQHYPTQTEWFFGGMNADMLAQLLRSASVPAVLLDQSRWRIEPDGIHVPVNPEIILGLSGTTRQSLYPVLGRYPQNAAQFTPYRCLPDGIADWFARSDLSPATISAVTNRLYRQQDLVCFSDLGEVLTLLPSSAERLQLAKTLTRESTMLLKLHVDENTDVSALLKYWGRRGRAKDLEPLLESLKRVPGGASIDVAHLLPPFARKRLYTYPLPMPNAGDEDIDCFWSSFNFFAEPPEFRYGTTAQVKAALDEQYYVAQDDPQLGDILMITDERGVAVHAAVYVADDIVFTKNGSAFVRPWLLMELRDVMAIYTGVHQGRIKVYRLKDTD